MTGRHLALCAALLAALWSGPAWSVAELVVDWPATVAGGATFTSDAIEARDHVGIFACATMTQAGTLSIQRYADRAGTIAIGTAISQAMTANTNACAAVNDGMPYLSFKISIANSSGSTGTVSAAAAGAGPP